MIDTGPFHAAVLFHLPPFLSLYSFSDPKGRILKLCISTSLPCDRLVDFHFRPNIRIQLGDQCSISVHHSDFDRSSRNSNCSRSDWVGPRAVVLLGWQP